MTSRGLVRISRARGPATGVLGVIAFMLGAFGCNPERVATVERCGNGLDDDLDGRIDCRDDDCVDSLVCLGAVGFVPALPPWVGSVDEGEVPDQPQEFPTDCDEMASDDTRIYSLGCRLAEGDCGDGLRCIVLTQEGSGVETGCVRQGCSDPDEQCSPHAQGVGDSCSRSTLCFDLDGVPRCRSLCSLIDPDCNDCLPLNFVHGDGLEALEGWGVCFERNGL